MTESSPTPAGETPAGETSAGETYAGAGVSIDAGEEAVDRIKSKVRSTFRSEVIGDIGGFGGLFALDIARYRAPVLVSSTDGVGTKALVAQATNRFTTIGIDLVAMCVDDLVCQGAEPLFFLDYVAVGRLDPDHIEQLIEGVAEGCRQAGCALIGGEMAEHPGAMEPGEFDLVGFAVGVAERDALISGTTIAPGDVLIGLPSTNLRSNGYSLARRVLLERAQLPLDGPAYPGAHHTLADELLAPSVIFSPAIAALQRAVDVLGVAHIAPAQFGHRAVKGLALEGLLAELDHLAVVGRHEAGRAEQVGLAHAPARHLGGVVLEAEVGPDEVEGIHAARHDLARRY
jgi:phosphoribosylformylglycinamidine cyclo-ligase